MRRAALETAEAGRATVTDSDNTVALDELLGEASAGRPACVDAGSARRRLVAASAASATCGGQEGNQDDRDDHDHGGENDRAPRSGALCGCVVHIYDYGDSPRAVLRLLSRSHAGGSL